MRGFNKNNVTPPEVKKDKKKRTHWQPNTFDSPPGQSTLPYTLVQKGLSTRVHSRRGTVMKMPPEYFTCPFNTSTDGAEERKVRTKRGRREGTKEKLLHSRCRNRRRGKSAVKESLFHLCVCYTLCSARFFHL